MELHVYIHYADDDVLHQKLDRIEKLLTDKHAEQIAEIIKLTEASAATTENIKAALAAKGPTS